MRTVAHEDWYSHWCTCRSEYSMFSGKVRPSRWMALESVAVMSRFSDDVEYLWRAPEGARTATIVAARFLHPATDDLGTPMAFGRTTYNHTASDLKHYCMARNNLVNLRDYRGWPAALAFVAKTAWFYTSPGPTPGRLPLSARAMFAGLRGDFTGHRKFLR